MNRRINWKLIAEITFSKKGPKSVLSVKIQPIPQLLVKKRIISQLAVKILTNPQVLIN